MITFNQFLEHKRVESTITECAHLMAEMEVNPYEYIYESLKEIDPVLAEGWWDNVKATAGNLWQGAKQVVKGAWSGGGLKQGLTQAADTIAGPAAKFDAAVRALADLEKTLSSNPDVFKNFNSSTGKGTVLDFVKIVKSNLEKDKQAMPKVQDAQVTQNYNTRGNIAAAAPAKAGGPGVDPQVTAGAAAAAGGP